MKLGFNNLSFFYPPIYNKEYPHSDQLRLRSEVMRGSNGESGDGYRGRTYDGYGVRFLD